MKDYPQLFDKFVLKAKNSDEFGEIYYKYKTDQLKGNAKIRHDELSITAGKFAKRFLGFTFAQYIVWLPFFILLFIILTSLGEVSLMQMYKNAPVLFWLLPVFLVLGCIGFVIVLMLKNKSQKQFGTIEQQASQVNKLIEEQFSIPKDVFELDLFTRYFDKNDKQISNYCIAFVLFQKDGFVFIEDLPNLLKIPQTDCILAEMIQENKYYDNYSYSVDYKSPEIKAQGIKRNRNNKGMYLAKQFGRLSFQTGSEIFTIDVPPYSFDKAKKLFGIISDN